MADSDQKQERLQTNLKMNADDKELSEPVKKQCLVSKKPKMRVIMPTEKFFFSVNWDETEDIDDGDNNREDIDDEAPLLVGHGFQDEFDHVEQKKRVQTKPKRKADEENLSEPIKKPKMRVVIPTEKFFFTLNWDETEDIDDGNSEDTDEEATLLVGHGFQDEFDHREQKRLVLGLVGELDSRKS